MDHAIVHSDGDIRLMACCAVMSSILPIWLSPNQEQQCVVYFSSSIVVMIFRGCLERVVPRLCVWFTLSNILYTPTIIHTHTQITLGFVVFLVEVVVWSNHLSLTDVPAIPAWDDVTTTDALWKVNIIM